MKNEKIIIAIAVCTIVVVLICILLYVFTKSGQEKNGAKNENIVAYEVTNTDTNSIKNNMTSNNTVKNETKKEVRLNPKFDMDNLKTDEITLEYKDETQIEKNKDTIDEFFDHYSQLYFSEVTFEIDMDEVDNEDTIKLSMGKCTFYYNCDPTSINDYTYVDNDGKLFRYYEQDKDIIAKIQEKVDYELGYIAKVIPTLDLTEEITDTGLRVTMIINKDNGGYEIEVYEANITIDGLQDPEMVDTIKVKNKNDFIKEIKDRDYGSLFYTKSINAYYYDNYKEEEMTVEELADKLF